MKNHFKNHAVTMKTREFLSYKDLIFVSEEQ